MRRFLRCHLMGDPTTDAARPRDPNFPARHSHSSRPTLTIRIPDIIHRPSNALHAPEPLEILAESHRAKVPRDLSWYRTHGPTPSTFGSLRPWTEFEHGLSSLGAVTTALRLEFKSLDGTIDGGLHLTRARGCGLSRRFGSDLNILSFRGWVLVVGTRSKFDLIEVFPSLPFSNSLDRRPHSTGAF
jgi:hypothetical protein